MKESQVETYFQWKVELLGGKTWKTKAIGQRGFPDRLACMPNGEMWLVELKAPHGRVSALQRQFAADMEQLRQRYVVLWDMVGVDAWAKMYELRTAK